MIQEILLFLLGIIMLLGGADILIRGSVKVARRLKVSPMVVGLTLVAFGTSFPELSISLIAALKGTSDIALGNVIGSNIANIGLILGLSALLFPIASSKSTLSFEAPFMILASFLLLFFGYFSLGNGITRIEGIILLAFFLAFLVYIYYNIKKQRFEAKLVEEYKEAYSDGIRPWLPLAMIAVGLLGVIAGAELVVDSSIKLASLLGIGQSTIALTVIAIGTSLPELVTSIVAAYKKEPDIAVGNIVGSNIFNILLILGASSALAPISVSPSFVYDIFFMIFFSILFLAFAFTGKRISKIEGMVLLVLYLGYVGYLVI